MAKPMPGTPSRHLFAEDTIASNGTRRASRGSAPNALIESSRRRRPRRAITAAISATGLSPPDVVSQCTRATWVLAPSPARAASPGAGSTARSSGTSSSTCARRWYWHMRSMRLPYAPLTSTSSLPSGGTSVASMASTMKVPLPCSGTHTCVPCPPARATSRSRTRALSAMKAGWGEPQSRSIACLVVVEVVSGPGVRRNGSLRRSIMRRRLLWMARSALHPQAGGIIRRAQAAARGEAPVGDLELELGVGDDAGIGSAGHLDIAHGHRAAERVAVGRGGHRANDAAVVVDGLVAPRQGVRIFHDERDEPLGEGLPALTEKRVASDEAPGLVPGHGEREARLERRVVAGELVPPRPVRLLHSQRVHRVVAGVLQTPRRARGERRLR